MGTHASQTDGNYTISGLVPGNYKIQANNNWEPGYVSKYFDDKPSIETADQVVVAAGQSVTGKNFSLEEGSTITGTVYQNENKKDRSCQWPAQTPRSAALGFAINTSDQKENE